MATKPAKVLPFTVEGPGEFPIDMLRFDVCGFAAPADEEAAGKGYRDPDFQGARRKVTLLSTSLNLHNKPTVGRWESFGWKVINVGRVFQSAAAYRDFQSLQEDRSDAAPNRPGILNATATAAPYHEDPQADELAVAYRTALVAGCRGQKSSSRKELDAYCNRLAAIGLADHQMHEAVKVIEQDVALIIKADVTLEHGEQILRQNQSLRRRAP
jgi:hypothetical protein